MNSAATYCKGILDVCWNAVTSPSSSNMTLAQTTHRQCRATEHDLCENEYDKCITDYDGHRQDAANKFPSCAVSGATADAYDTTYNCGIALGGTPSLCMADADIQSNWWTNERVKFEGCLTAV